MKKLVLAVAIVCAAAMTQAASVAWSLTGITANPEGTAVVGGIAYFMDSSTWDTFSATAVDALAAYCADNNLYSATITSGRTGTYASATSGSYSAGDTVSGYIVVFDTSTVDAAYYAYTEVDTMYVPGSGNLNWAKTFSAATTGWQSTSAVPEPTSGLLLLLGMAGLALKRKIA